MAKIRLRIGENEVEIESRDFYIDNETVGQVISEIAKNLENKARIITEEENSLETPPNQIKKTYQENLDYLKMLRDAEMHEPEFSPPVPVSADELQAKIELLENDSFFAQPRTVSETVEQMREYGWLASPLEVSKVLAKMAFHKELARDQQENKTFYFKKQLVA